jgi:4-hydroxy-tetrahydrodipicolinate reductase
MKKIRVAIMGLGAMGSGMAKLALEKSCIEVVGAAKNRPEGCGSDLGDFLGLNKKTGVIITNDYKSFLDPQKVDLVIHARNSFTHEAYPEIKTILEHKINCISISEELAYPEVQAPELAEKLDKLAKENNVTLLGTGVNPGFVLDLLIITLTGVCYDVQKIEARRVNDLSPFGDTVMRTQGVGTTVEEFNKGIEDGSIVGHIGFPESISMIAESLGWKLDEIKQTREPIISNTHRKTKYAEVHPGMVAGCRHIGIGIMGGKEVIVLEHPQQILPETEGISTGDFVKVYGTPEINVANTPEIPGGIGTIGIAVNMIPHVFKASPGLKRMIDLPAPSAISGDAYTFRRV